MNILMRVKDIMLKKKNTGMNPLFAKDSSTNQFQCAALLQLGSHYPPLRGIVQITNSDASQMTSCDLQVIRVLRLWDNSTIKFQCTSFLKFGSH